jgi:uncharacterized protein (TIGR03435 family)
MHMRAIAVVLLAAGGVLAQTPAAPPTFEAAFVKLNTTGSGGSRTHGTKGQTVMVNQPLKRLVERAYDVKPFQVIAPEWTENVRFDITAKYPENSKDSDRPAMLRALLEDRFKLATHMETKELPGYALVVAKGGLKIQPATTSESDGDMSDSSSNNQEVLRVTSIPMSEFTDFLARRLGSPVSDSTNASGHYSFELHWALEGDVRASDFAAIQEAIVSIGLRLQATRVPVQIVVVDRIERVPTEN